MNPESTLSPAGTSPAATSSTVPLPAAAAPPPFTDLVLKHILVPLDFSVASHQALHYATALAAPFHARLCLLHVIEFHYLGSEFGAVELTQIEKDLHESAQQQLETLAQQAIGNRVPWEILLRIGRPYYEIVETARTLPADLILIAAHGHSRLTHILLGSTVERVVRHAPCPVLTVRQINPATPATASTAPPAPAGAEG